MEVAFTSLHNGLQTYEEERLEFDAGLALQFIKIHDTMFDHELVLASHSLCFRTVL